MNDGSLNIIDMDATDIAKLIGKGTLTSEEVVRTYINHIKKINPLLNAVIEDRFVEAIEEAKRCDKDFHAIKEKGPLYGVPISIKESFDVTHLKTTGALIHLQDNTVNEDAVVVNKLKGAGAIILGKTNTPTLCYCQETDNKLYGRTNNPWDLMKSAGGSSGGEGALLASGGAAVGIGSDIGGSIRLPSHFNGVIGFKSGKAQIDSTGHFPADTIALQARMSSIGPMGKSVRDMKLIYEIIAKEKPPFTHIFNVEIDLLPRDIKYPLSTATKGILSDIELFLKKTFKTKRQVPPYFKESAELWQEIMSVDGGKEMRSLGFNTKHPKLIPTYIKEKLTGKTDTHSYLS